MKEKICSKDCFATLLLCSDICDGCDEAKLFSELELSQLDEKIEKSKIKSIGGLLDHTEGYIKKGLKLSEKENVRINSLLSRSINMAFMIENLDHRGIKVIEKYSEKYPIRMLENFKRFTPPFLFYCGNINILNYKKKDKSKILIDDSKIMVEIMKDKEIIKKIDDGDLILVSVGNPKKIFDKSKYMYNDKGYMYALLN